MLYLIRPLKDIFSLAMYIRYQGLHKWLLGRRVHRRSIIDLAFSSQHCYCHCPIECDSNQGGVSQSVSEENVE